MKITNGGLILSGMWVGAGAGVNAGDDGAIILFIAVVSTLVWIAYKRKLSKE